MLDQKILENHLIKLNFDNHQIWYKRLVGLIDFLALEDHLDETKAIDDEEWVSKDKEIKDVILNFVDDCLKRYICDVDSAAKCCAKLENACQNHKSDDQLLYQLDNFKLNYSSLEEFDRSIDEFRMINEQLLASDIVCGSSKFASIKLINLTPQDYKEKLIKTVDPVNFEDVLNKIRSDFQILGENNVESVQKPATRTREEEVRTENDHDNQDSGIKIENPNQIQDQIDDKSDFDLDQPTNYKDNAFILDSSKMVDLPNSTTNSEIIQDIRFMKQEDLEASKPSSIVVQNNPSNFLGNASKDSRRRNSPNNNRRRKQDHSSREQKNRNDSHNKSGGYRRSNENSHENLSSDTSKQEQEKVDPYKVNQYATIDLFKRLQASKTIQICNEMLTTNLTKPVGLHYNSN